MAEDAVKTKEDKAPEKPKAVEAAATTEKDATAKLQADAGHVPPPSDASKAAGSDNKSASADASKGTDGKTTDGKNADGKTETGEKAKSGDDKAEGNKEGEERTAAELACEMWDCLKKDYLDAKSRVTGLMGFALHPEMAKSGKTLHIDEAKKEPLKASGALDFSVPSKPLTAGLADTSGLVTQATEKPAQALANNTEATGLLKFDDYNMGFFHSADAKTATAVAPDALATDGKADAADKLNAAPTDNSAATDKTAAPADKADPDAGKAWYETGFTGMLYNGGKAVIDTAGDLTYSLYKGSGMKDFYDTKISPLWDSYSDEFATSLTSDGKSVNEVVKNLSAEKGVVVETVKKDGALESCTVGDSSTCWRGTPQKFEHTTSDGVTFSKEGRNLEVSLKGGDKVSVVRGEKGALDQTITKANGDTVKRLPDGTYELYDKANDITTRVKGSEQLEKTYGQTFKYVQDLTMDTRQLRHQEYERARTGHRPEAATAASDALNAPGKQAVVDTKDGSTINNDQSKALMTRERLEIILSNGQGGAIIQGDKVQMTDSKGEPIVGQSMSLKEFMEKNRGQFGGWKIASDNGGVEAVDAENSGRRLRLDRASSEITASQAATTGPDAGKTISSVTAADNKRVIEYKGADDKPIQTTTVDPNHPERGIVEQTAGEQGHRVFDLSNPNDVKFKEYTSQDENPSTLKYELGEHSSYFDGATVNHDTGEVFYDSASGGRYTVFNSSPESYAAATSAANSASSHGGSVASQVNAAVSAGNYTSDAYRGLAIGAIANVDAAIQQCMVTGNFEGFGNLISTKDRLINALNSLNDKSNKFDDASKLGLSTEQAKYVAENTGNGSLHKAIEEVKTRANGRKPESW
ncbi:MAG: hypothetical protein JNN26_03585 [Candidatus Obscuribacter sp.]|nr:hypothetical protein [Candidatus Obscuribacter sp.]